LFNTLKKNAEIYTTPIPMNVQFQLSYRMHVKLNIMFSFQILLPHCIQTLLGFVQFESERVEENYTVCKHSTDSWPPGELHQHQLFISTLFVCLQKDGKLKYKFANIDIKLFSIIVLF
jgi:hypothetical protein